MRKPYPSDVTDAQWARVAPIFESATRGRPRQIPAREVVNAILYVMKNGCAWLCKWRRIAKNWCFSLKGFTPDVEWALFGLTLRRSRADTA